MTGTPSFAQTFPYLRATSSAPGFSRPIELRIPAGVSAIRYCGLPGRARGVVPLFTIAPSRPTSMSSAYSTPWPNVPDAVSTGFLSQRPRAASTERSTPCSGSVSAGACGTARTSVITAPARLSRSLSAISVGSRSASGSPAAASAIDAPSRSTSSTRSSSSSPSAASSSDSSSERRTSIGRSICFFGRRHGTSGHPRSRARRPRTRCHRVRTPDPRGRRARCPPT